MLNYTHPLSGIELYFFQEQKKIHVNTKHDLTLKGLNWGCFRLPSFELYCGNTRRKASVSTALSNSSKLSWVFLAHILHHLLEKTLTRKRKQLVHFDHQGVNSHYVDSECPFCVAIFMLLSSKPIYERVNFLRAIFYFEMLT